MSALLSTHKKISSKMNSPYIPCSSVIDSNISFNLHTKHEIPQNNHQGRTALRKCENFMILTSTAFSNSPCDRRTDGR